MKKRLNLTIDDDVYAMLQELPRKVSVSEVVSYVLKAMFQDLKKGRELTDDEFNKWIESDPKLKDFRERLREHWGPSIEKIDETVEKVKNSVRGRGKK